MTALPNYRSLMRSVTTFPGLKRDEIAEFAGAFRFLSITLAVAALVIFIIANGILEFRTVVLYQVPLALLLIATHLPRFDINGRSLLALDGFLFVIWGLTSHAFAPMGFSVGYYVALTGISCLYVALGARTALVIMVTYVILAATIGSTIREHDTLRLVINAISFAMLSLWLMSLMYGLAAGLQRRDKTIALQQQLAQTSQRQARMFSIIAHELRTPAAAARMLADQPDLASSRRELQSATQHLLSVIDDMRVAVNPDASFELNKGPFDPLDLLNDIERQITPLLSDGAFTLHIQSQFEDTNILSGDAYRLRAIATNLLRNAYHHSNGSDIWLRAGSVSVDDQQATLWLEIEDNGEGIPEADFAKLLQPFERGKSTAPGAGLGLHIVNTWSQRLGGSLNYFPGTAGGAGFRLEVTLPVYDGKGASEPEYLERAQIILAGRRVLMAEDDWLNAKLVSNMLGREFDLELRLARDGAEALELAGEQPFDLVITDYHMPKLSGLELTRALREQGYKGPVIGLTAATLGAEADDMLAAGAEEVLGKPMDLNTFGRIVVRLAETGKL